MPVNESLTHGAVALIETPHVVVLEDRPNWPGQLAYAGKLGFYGGHVEAEEDATTAVLRELDQELKLRLEEVPPILWEGQIMGESKSGRPRPLRVSLFHVVIASSVGLQMQVPGQIARIPRSLSAIEAQRQRLTPFAYLALKGLVSGAELNDTTLGAIEGNLSHA